MSEQQPSPTGLPSPRTPSELAEARLAAPPSGQALLAYLEGQRPGEVPGAGGWRARTRGLVPPAARGATKTVLTRAQHPASRRAVARLLASGDPVLLNLGSGTRPVEGWTNVDLWGARALWGVRPDLVWDLRRGLPVPDGSADGVFLEHVVEHFTLAQSLEVLTACRRALRPGGVLRMSVPDFGRYARSYAGDGQFLEGVRPGCPEPMLALLEVAHGHGHLSLWDGPTACRVLLAAGFDEAEERPFGSTRLTPVPDAEARRLESLYVEAVT